MDRQCSGKTLNGNPCTRRGWTNLDGKWACSMHIVQVFGRTLSIQEMDEQREARKEEEYGSKRVGIRQTP